MQVGSFQGTLAVPRRFARCCVLLGPQQCQHTGVQTACSAVPRTQSLGSHLGKRCRTLSSAAAPSL